jgi:hypothetical protein
MKRILLLLTSLVALVLPSCLQNETVIYLNKDGSGTLVEETTLGEQMSAMLAQFAALGGGGEDPLAEMFSEQKGKARAASFGEGVTFEKAEMVQRGVNKGGRVTYRFTDINTLRISPGDGMKNVNPGADLGIAAAAADKADPITFSFTDGSLPIQVPHPDVKDVPAEAADLAGEAANPEMEAMMKQMLGDMRVSFKLVAESGIAETNATHREGNTVNLMEIDFGKLLKNEGAFQKLSSVDQNDMEATMALLRDFEGVKFEPQKEVTVSLK